MPQVYRVEFSIFEPMMFRSSGEFDPLARGVQASASSLPLPSPSTISGTLATLTLEKKGGSPSGEDWIDEYLSILGSDFTLKGPFLEIEDELYVEDRLLGTVIKLKAAVRKIRKLSKVLSLEEPKDAASIKKNLKFFEELRKIEEDLKPGFHLKFSERVGVGLRVRSHGVKTVTVKEEEGLLYSASFIDYSSSEFYGVKVVADAKGSVLEEVFSSQLTVPVRFGGEGRVSILSISKDESVIDRLKEVWRGTSSFTGILGLYVSSPVLFRCTSSFKVFLKTLLEDRGLSLKAVYGETEVLGAGFSLARRKRKPIYGSLKPGSIIFAEAENCDLEELYWSGLGDASTKLGYGTVIPIPLRTHHFPSDTP